MGHSTARCSRVVRKSIARVLTVINQTQKENLRKFYKVSGAPPPGPEGGSPHIHGILMLTKSRFLKLPFPPPSSHNLVALKH